MAANKVVCVTGVGGYIASWVVKLLLSKGYTVHGTVRNPSDDKNVHLKNLEYAAEKLKLFKADLLDYDSISAAIKGCNGVFHVASPIPPGSVPNPEVEVVEPAVKEGYEVMEDKTRMIIDVRDVAEALKFVYELPEAEGRYICVAHMVKTKDIVEKLRQIYPHYNYPKRFTEGAETENLSSEKLKRLGLKYKPLEETLVDSVESYKQLGLLD